MADLTCDPSWSDEVCAAAQQKFDEAFSGAYTAASDTVSTVQGLPGKALQKAASAAAEGWAKDVSTSVDQSLVSLGGSWVRGSSSADLTSQDSVVVFLNNNLLWLKVSLFTICLIIAGMRIVWSMRGSEEPRKAVEGIMTLIVVSAAGAFVVDNALKVSNAMSNAILDAGMKDVDGGFAGKIAAVLAAAGPGVGVVLTIVGGLIAILANLWQEFLLIVRDSFLPILVGFMPLAASVAMTETGKAWLRKMAAWVMAFVAFQPVASVIYCAAILIGDKRGTPGDALETFIQALVLMVAAAFALPALVALFAPMTQALGSGGGGALSGAIGGMAATGAMGMTRSGWLGGRGSKGDRGQRGPTGAATTSTGGRDKAPSRPPSGAVSSGVSSSGAAGAAGAKGASAGAGAGAGGASAGAGAGAGAAAGAGPVGAAAAVGVEAGKTVVKGVKSAVGSQGGGAEPTGAAEARS